MPPTLVSSQRISLPHPLALHRGSPVRAVVAVINGRLKRPAAQWAGEGGCAAAAALAARRRLLLLRSRPPLHALQWWV